ncbi:uncharacterized protein [Rhodnius prolixus]|uniref:Putative wd40 domain protein n=1 Tax=Rhodnius prolixus TaxID=13249 RepID=A0A4P6D8W8_RHOPR
MDDPVLEQHFVGHKGTITSLSFNPSDKQLLSSSEDHTFMNWNLTSSSGSLRYQAKALPVTHICYSPNGNLIASAQGQAVRLWMSTIRGKSIEFKTHFAIVRSVQFSPDGNNLLTASDDKSLKIWITSKRKFLTSLSGNGGHTNWVRFGTYSSDGHLIASCSDDKTTKIWDPVTSKLVYTFNEVRGAPRYVKFHPSSSCIGVAMATGAVKLYDLKMMKLLQYYPCHDGSVNSLSFHPEGVYLITAGSDSTSKILDLIEGRAILSLEGHKKAVTSVTFSNSGKYFATASADKNVFVWKTNLNENVWDSREALLKESLSNDCVPITRLETCPQNLKDPEITEVYCAKDYQELQNKMELPSVPSCNVMTSTSTSGSDLKESSMKIRNEHVGDEIQDVNSHSHMNSISELVSQVAFLTDKLIDMESRLKQMEEMMKLGGNSNFV